MYLKRKIDSYLLGWKTNKNHKPIIIKETKQVGKTQSIRVFVKANYD